MLEKGEQRILVLGAAGRSGHRLCQQALDAGYQVDVLIREPGKFKVSEQPCLRVIVGDLSEPSVFDEIFRIPYFAVLSTVGIFHKTPATPLADLTATLIEHMNRAGVRRLVCMSSLGVSDSKGQGNLTVRFVARFVLKFVLRVVIP